MPEPSALVYDRIYPRTALLRINGNPARRVPGMHWMADGLAPTLAIVRHRSKVTNDMYRSSCAAALSAVAAVLRLVLWWPGTQLKAILRCNSRALKCKAQH